ncbi:MAG TPA: hypothetical protein PK826_13480 [Anaerolineae bacterium]|jgi:hypothetical protein|nr:hypothetical protein [Ardenticatenia bacterium]HQZ72325.1 hypothetical protein [Anaerolineae bacterium]
MVVTPHSEQPDYPDLTAGQPYVVIGIEADDFRLLNDQGQPYLYPATLFDVLDAREPRDWVIAFGDEGERYAYPQSLNGTGFFEDFFDARRPAVSTFWRVVNQRLALAAA